MSPTARAVRERTGAAERLGGWRWRRRLPGAEMTLPEHLEELRYRLLVSLAALAAGFMVGWRATPHVLDVLRGEAGRLVVVTPAEAFVTYLRVAFTVGLAVASPIIVAQIWLFVVPGLYPAEIALAARIGPAAAVLFAAGLAFGSAVVFPIAMRFLLGQAGSGVVAALSVSRVLSFALGLVLPFGVVFQLPLAAYVAGRLGLVEPTSLARLRRWAVLLAFVVGAVLTPPDVISQVLMSVPLVVLYEVAIVTARWGARARARGPLADGVRGEAS